MLLPDDAHASIAKGAPFRQAELLDQLLAHVRRYLSRPRRCRPQQAPVIALLGRYGQGKSSVLHALSSKVDGIFHGYSFCRIHLLDVTRYRPDDIQYSFEALIAPRVILRRFGVMLVLLTLTGLYLIPGLLGYWSQTSTPSSETLRVIGITGSVVATLVMTLLGGALGATILSQSVGLFAIGLHGDLSLNWLKTLPLLLFAPDLIIIDNLDRATTDQQKALLRSIHRVRNNLRGMVVVAMDQTKLIESSPDPESAPELLRKVFDLQLQMPPMTALDARIIARAVFGEARALNDARVAPELAWIDVLVDSPLVLGDFGRIIFLHRRHSQRFPRRFLNNALAAAHTIDARTPLAFAALLRLHGLFEYLPSLQHDPLAIAALMRSDDGPGLVAHAALHLGKPVPAEIADAVNRYMAATRHMHPDFADWQAFTGRFAKNEVASEEAGSEVSSQASWAPWAGPELAGLAAEWLRFDVQLAEEEDNALERLQAFDRSRSGPALSHPTDSAMSVSPARMLAWRFLLYRLWLADGAVHRLMSEHHRTRLLNFSESVILGNTWNTGGLASPDGTQVGARDILQALLRLLPNTPAGSHSLAQAALFAATKQIGRRPETDAVRQWLSNARPDVPELNGLVLKVFNVFDLEPTESAPLAQAWPQPKADAPRDWTALCRQVQIARVLRPFGCDVPLRAASQALAAVSWDVTATVADRDGFLELWSSTCPDFVGGDSITWDWKVPMALWDDAWILACERPSSQRAFEDYLLDAFASWHLRPSQRHAGFFVTATLLAHWPLDPVAPRLERALADLSYDLRPTGSGWDYGFLQGLCSLERLNLSGLVGPGWEKLRGLLRAEAERLQEDDDVILNGLGDRLQERLQ